MSETSQPYHVPEGKWEFDSNVTDIFENMLRRSIPQYDVMRKGVTDLACEISKGVDNGCIVDLGCSRGDMIAELRQRLGDNFSYVGIDVSESMLNVCKERFKNSPNIQIHNTDLRYEYPSFDKKVTCVVSVLTLQFIPIEYRQSIVSQIYDSLEPGGAFILVEKVLGNNNTINNLLTKLYYDLKQENGYTPYEIERKRFSLEGVLVPVKAMWNEQLLTESGFSSVDCFWRWMNFSGWIGIKN